MNMLDAGRQALIRDQVAQRNDAFLSGDRSEVERYMRRVGVPVPGNDLVFWTMVHQCRTAIRGLPKEAREFSKRWLHVRGLKSYDDGDVYCMHCT